MGYKKISVSVGVIIYNEEQNIGRLLESLLQQKTTIVGITEIIVISSGSTDKSNIIVKNFCKTHPRIRLLRQKKRLGKASAVNLFLSTAKEEVLILSSGDILLSKNTMEKIIVPLKKSSIGIVGSHPVPLNDKNIFFGFAAHLLWNLHHEISLKTPKMGEFIAFRKVFRQIPALSSVDEANIEAVVRGQGYKAVYATEAIIYNKGAETAHEFIARRRHVYAGHLITKHEYGYEVSTIKSTRIIFLLLKHSQFSWRFILWAPAVVLLEAASRFLGFLDYKYKLRSHTVWQVTTSTKKLPQISHLSE